MKWRMMSISVLFSVLLLGLIMRLAYIQLFHGHEYRQQIMSQSSSYLSEIPVRGTIYDRNNKPVTNSSEGLLLLIEKEKMNHEIMGILQSLNASPINGTEDKHRLFLVDFTDISNIEKKLKGYGVIFMKLHKYMPDQEPVSHIIGSVNPLDNSGASGIEKDYNHILDLGKMVFAVRKDGLGNLIQGEGINIDGDDRIFGVITTIDLGIQKSIEEILNKSLTKGSIVITEIGSGEILASASYPSYLPDEIENYSEKEERFINKATMRTYKAGAVYDLILAAAQVEETIAAANLYVTKDYFYEEYNQKPYPEEGEIIETIEKFNFHKKAISGYGEQVVGNAEEFKKNIGKADIDGHQDLFITPMQVARAINIIAAEGKDRELSLVKGTIEGVKGVFYYPKGQEKQMISDETANILMDKIIVKDTNWWCGVFAKGQYVYGITIYVENPLNYGSNPEFIYNKVLEGLRN